MSIRVAFLRTRSFSFRNEESEMDLIDSLVSCIDATCVTEAPFKKSRLHGDLSEIRRVASVSRIIELEWKEHNGEMVGETYPPGGVERLVNPHY